MSEAKGGQKVVLGVAILLIAGALAGGLWWRLGQGGEAALAAEIMAGIELGKAGKLEEAAQHLAKVVAQHPSSTDALFNYGVALGALEKLAEADQVYVRLLDLDPKDWSAVAERAALAFARGDKEAGYGFLEQIPPGQANMVERLKLDPLYQTLAREDRMRLIRAKHGMPDLGYESAGGTEN